MSSRLLPAEASLPVEEVAWRRVDGGSPGTPLASAPGPAQTVDPEIEAARRREWEQVCEQRVQAARTAAFREGEAAAREQCAAEARSAAEQLARAIADVASLKPRLRREAEGDLVRLALAIARRVLYREAAVDPDAMRGIALAALAKLEGRDILRVRAHPNLAAMLGDVLRRAVNDRLPEIVGDPSRLPGTLIFETARGNLDASVEAQLQEIENGLVERLERSR